jgi:hypothetical protein
MENKTKNRVTFQLDFFLIFLAPAIFLIIWIMFDKPILPWDSVWYRGIVDFGYHFDGDITKQQNVGFLPGYPLLIKAISVFTGLGTNAAQIVVSLSCFIIGCLAFFRVLSSRLDNGRAALVIIIWSMLPFSIYFYNGYSEALMFAVAGLFFLFIENRSLNSACIVISYGLISRPHSLMLLPVLMYYLFQCERKNVNGSLLKVLFNSVIRLIELIPVIVIFPILLTIYYYISFDDSLIYKNALYAWSTFLQPALSFESIIKSLSDIASGSEASEAVVYKLAFHIISPKQFSIIILLMSFASLFFLLQVKYFDFFIFNFGILIFGIVKSDPGNIGRHLVMMFSFPILFATIFYWLVQFLNKLTLSNKYNYTIVLIFTVGFMGVFVVLLLSFLLIQFIWFSFMYMNKAWVS